MSRERKKNTRRLGLPFYLHLSRIILKFGQGHPWPGQLPGVTWATHPLSTWVVHFTYGNQAIFLCWKVYYLFAYLFLKSHPRACLSRRGGGSEREKEKYIDVREEHQSFALQTGDWTATQVTQVCALTRSQNDNLSVQRTTLHQLSHSGEGKPTVALH